MKVYLKIINKLALPTIRELVETMYKKGINISKAGDSIKFKDCTTFSMCWDKWVDDKRWDNHPKFKEYIYFDAVLTDKDIICIEIDDDATFVDKRAFCKATILIAEKQHQLISYDGLKWIIISEFVRHENKYLKCNFEGAIEISLTDFSE